MKHLVEKIANKEYDSAKDIFESRMFDLVEKKLLEAKKSTGAKMMEQPMGQIGPTVPEKRKTGVIEADVSSGKMLKSPKEDKLSNWIKNNAAQYAGSSAISSLASKVASHVHPGMTNPIGIAADIMLNPTTANAGEEEQLKKMRDGEKTVAMKEAYGKGYVSPAKKIEDAMKKRGIDPNSSDKYRKEMERLNAQYEKLKAKDKKIDEEEQSTSWANPSTWIQKFKQSRQDALDKAGITSQDYKDLAKNILPSAVKATGDVVGKIATEKGQEKNLEKSIDKNLPVNAATMTKHMMGLTTGIKDSEKFSSDERKSILDVSAKSHERSKGQKEKGATYYQTQRDKDYDDKEYSNVGKKGGMFGSNLKQMVGGTLDQGKSGAEYRVHTTLGGFGYKPTQKGLEVRDTYNFDDKSKGKKADSAYLKVRQAGEKADAKYADAPEKQQTKFTIPKSELQSHPYWSRVYAKTDRRDYQAPSASQAPAEPKNVKLNTMTPAKTSTPSTSAYKAPAQPKAMTPATPKAPTTRQRFNAEYKAAKTRGDKQFTFDNKPYAVNEDVELDEARVKIVKARIRGGKIQRRKRVSNVPGMTIRSGKLIRMSPAERRRRRLGQKRGKIKRRAKLSRTLMKRQRSLRKRKSLGL